VDGRPLTERYADLFRTTAAADRIAMIPFLVLGDPDLATSGRLLAAVLEAGADAIEVAIPFSDPVADGPVIQAAAARAIAAGATPDRCWDVLADLRRRWDRPIGLLVYANLVVRPGLAAFYHSAARAGVDSVLVADLPVEESGPFLAEAIREGVAPVFVAPPNADPEVLTRIAAATSGYTYVTSRKGVTGTGGADGELGATIDRLARLGAPPPVVGFGLSNAGAIASVRRMGAAGAIVGSALIAAIERARSTGADPVAAAVEFVTSLRPR
jgi:tryptophan synthase alpha chain